MNRLSGFLVFFLWVFALGHCLAETVDAHPEMPVSDHHHHHHGEDSTDPVSHSDGEHGDACEIAACKPEYSSVLRQFERLHESIPSLLMVTIADLSVMSLSQRFLKPRLEQTESSVVSSLTRTLSLAPNAPPVTL